MRHLAYLADTDPAIAAAAAVGNHHLWQAIRTLGPAIPAAVHELAHHTAENLAVS